MYTCKEYQGSFSMLVEALTISVLPGRTTEQSGERAATSPLQTILTVIDGARSARCAWRGCLQIFDCCFRAVSMLWYNISGVEKPGRKGSWQCHP